MPNQYSPPGAARMFGESLVGIPGGQRAEGGERDHQDHDQQPERAQGMLPQQPPEAPAQRRPHQQTVLIEDGRARLLSGLGGAHWNRTRGSKTA